MVIVSPTKSFKALRANAKNEKKGLCGNLILWFVFFVVAGWCCVILIAWGNGYLHLSAWKGTTNPSPDSLLRADEGQVTNNVEIPRVATPIPVAAIPNQVNQPEAVKLSGEYTIVPGPKGVLHVIFSTDCEAFQDWQSIVVFHSARTVGQVGPVTRIASGCADEKKVELTALYKKLYPEYRVHFTPDFKKDEKTGKSYHFYNKPYGLQHWLQYADPPIPDHTIIALIDPDMVFIRPITTQVDGLDNILYNKRVVTNLPKKIERGVPVAQLYGLGAPWARDYHKKFNRSHICGTDSPCMLEQEDIAANHYAVGPPYIVEKRDMWRIAQTWTEFVPRVFEGYPYLLAEMYAYSMGAAHEKLPHLQLEQYMVSNVHAGGEGWSHVDKLKENVCVPPDEHGIFYPGHPMPALMHYCQGYHAGEIGIMKRRVPKDLFTCESPMLLDPPNDLGTMTFMLKNGVERKEAKPLEIRRNAFSACIIIRALNAAILDYKTKMCDVKTANFDKTINVEKLPQLH